MKILTILLDFFIPSEWKKPMAIAILGGILVVAGIGASMLIRRVVLEEVHAVYTNTSTDTDSKFIAIHTELQRQRDDIRQVKSDVKKIDRLDGKMDTVIHLLKKH